MSSWALVITALLGWGAVGAAGQCQDNANGTSTTSPLDLATADGALHWVYHLNEVFMEDLIPTELWEETFPEGKALTENLVGKLVQHFRGYLILAGVGLVFVVCLPIAGCCFCCCHTKNTMRNGAKQKACAGCFFVFVALLILGVSFAMVASGFVSAQFEERDGLGAQLAESIRGLDRFVNGTADSLRDVKHVIVPSLTDIARQVGQVPETAHYNMGQETGAVPLFAKLERYAKNLNRTVGHFKSMKRQTSDLLSKCATLEVNVNTLKSNISDLLTNCTEQPCIALLNSSAALSVGVNFSSVSDVQHAIRNMTISLTQSPSITASVDLGDTVWQLLGAQLVNASHGFTHNAEKSISIISSEIDDALEDVVDFIGSLHPGELGADLGGKLRGMSGYAQNALLALCGLPLLVGVLYLLAMMFGFFGHPPGGGAFCSTGKGACCALLGITLTFLLAWVVMLVVTALFFAGSVAHNELCQPLLNPFQNRDLKFLSKWGASSSLRIDVLATLESCQKNEALYTALDIETLFPKFNITKLLDLSQYNFDHLLDDLPVLNITTGHVILMNQAAQDHLVELNKGYDTVDFMTYHEALRKDITSEDMGSFAKFMELQGSMIQDNVYKGRVAQLTDEARRIHRNFVNDVEASMAELKTSVGHAQAFVLSLDTPTFIPAMDAAQAQLDGAALVGSLRGAATAIYRSLQELTRHLEVAVRCDVGRCREVSSALSRLVGALCWRLLRPVNAVWFGVGWCLVVMVVPLVAVATSLGDQWRATSVLPARDDVEMKGLSGVQYRKSSSKRSHRVHPA